MANTGLTQAVIVYKVRASDNTPLDVDDNPITESGKRQAIAVLMGTPNPNPALYEIEFVFTPGGAVEGVPTVQASDNCPAGYIFLSERRALLQTSGPAFNFTLTSSGPWSLTSQPPGPIATLSLTSGPRGVNGLTITRTTNIGQGYFVFTNSATGQTARIYIVNVDVAIWVLETDFWNNLGIWFDDGIWNY